MRFDEMAVLVRSPQNYVGLIEHALRRARVPAWFSRGTRRPLTAGRAFLALLACASEQLSASRFAEYLSFAQVPLETREGGSDAGPPRRTNRSDVSSHRSPRVTLRIRRRRAERFGRRRGRAESGAAIPGSRVRVRARWNPARALAVGSAHRRCRGDRPRRHALEASPRRASMRSSNDRSAKRSERMAATKRQQRG